MTLNLHHLEVLAGIAECPDGRMTYELEPTVLPSQEHKRALIELRRNHYVFRRHVGGTWHPRAVHRLTRHGRAAVAPKSKRK